MTDVNKEKNIPRDELRKTNKTGTEAGNTAANTDSSSSAVDAVADLLAATTIHTGQDAAKKEPSPQALYEQAKKAYVESRFNPTDPTEKAILELWLKVPKEVVKKPDSESEAKQYDEALRLAKERENKLIGEKRDLLVKQFEADFELRVEENKLLEAFAKEHFKPSAKWVYQSQVTYDAQVIKEREKFIADNKKTVLLEELRKAIRVDIGLANTAEIEELDRLEATQNLSETSAYKTRVGSQLPDKSLAYTMKQTKQANKPAIELFYKAKQHLGEQGNPTVLFSTKALSAKPKAREGLLVQFQDRLESAKNHIRSEEALKKKPFTRLGLKPKA